MNGLPHPCPCALRRGRVGILIFSRDLNETPKLIRNQTPTLSRRLRQEWDTQGYDY